MVSQITAPDAHLHLCHLALNILISSNETAPMRSKINTGILVTVVGLISCFRERQTV